MHHCTIIVFIEFKNDSHAYCLFSMLMKHCCRYGTLTLMWKTGSGLGNNSVKCIDVKFETFETFQMASRFSKLFWKFVFEMSKLLWKWVSDQKSHSGVDFTRIRLKLHHREDVSALYFKINVRCGSQSGNRHNLHMHQEKIYYLYIQHASCPLFFCRKIHSFDYMWISGLRWLYQIVKTSVLKQLSNHRNWIQFPSISMSRTCCKAVGDGTCRISSIFHFKLDI